MWYTYKLSAQSDALYYLGVRHCPSNSTPETDEYLGSGASKRFTEWRALHIVKGDLSKEVLDTFASSAEAYLAEERLIGDLWQNDPAVLNASPGGKWNNRLLPAAPCPECLAGTGNHLVSCSRYEARPKCVECGAGSGNHRRACSRAVLCEECSGGNGRHRKACSLFVSRRACSECGSRANHLQTCSLASSCSECFGAANHHTKNCSLYKARTACGECGTAYTHRRDCSSYAAGLGCKECGSRRKGSHTKLCSLFKPVVRCEECGVATTSSHRKNCSQYKPRGGCDECSSRGVKHKRGCSKFVGCSDCGSGTWHKKDCKKKLVVT